MINRLQLSEIESDQAKAYKVIKGYVDRHIKELSGRDQELFRQAKDRETALMEAVEAVKSQEAEIGRLQEAQAAQEFARIRDRDDHLGMVKALQQVKDTEPGAGPAMIAVLAQSFADRMDKGLSEKEASDAVRFAELKAMNDTLRSELEQSKAAQDADREEMGRVKADLYAVREELISERKAAHFRHDEVLTIVKSIPEMVKGMPVPIVSPTFSMPPAMISNVIPEGAIVVKAEGRGTFDQPEPRKTTVEKSIVYANDGSGRPEKIIETRTEE